MAHGDFKDVARRTASDYYVIVFNIAKNSKYHGYQRGIGSIV